MTICLLQRQKLLLSKVMRYRFIMIINWFKYLKEWYDYHTYDKFLIEYTTKLDGAKLLGTDLDE